jgi:hypothetical protein
LPLGGYSGVSPFGPRFRCVDALVRNHTLTLPL